MNLNSRTIQFCHKAIFCIKNGLLLGVLASIVTLLGCGGGTTGTGDFDSTRIEGKVIRLDGTSLAGAEVTVLETGDSTVTNASGDFIIEARLDAAEVNLSVISGALSATVNLGATPPSGSTITVQLLADEGENTVTIISADVTTPPTPTPSSNKSSSSDGNSSSQGSQSSSSSSSGVPSSPSEATPTPTPIADLVPTNTPTPGPTPTPTSTPIILNSIYRGTITGFKGGAITNAVVTVVATGDAIGTSAQGIFFIITDNIGPGTVTLNVTNSSGKSAQLDIPNVPAGAIFADLTITYFPVMDGVIGSNNFRLELDAVTFTAR